MRPVKTDTPPTSDQQVKELSKAEEKIGSVSDLRERLANAREANGSGVLQGDLDTSIAKGAYEWRVKGLGQRGLRWRVLEQKDGMAVVEPSIASLGKQVSSLGDLVYAPLPANKIARSLK